MCVADGTQVTGLHTHKKLVNVGLQTASSGWPSPQQEERVRSPMSERRRSQASVGSTFSFKSGAPFYYHYYYHLWGEWTVWVDERRRGVLIGPRGDTIQRNFGSCFPTTFAASGHVPGKGGSLSLSAIARDTCDQHPFGGPRPALRDGVSHARACWRRRPHGFHAHAAPNEGDAQNQFFFYSKTKNSHK